ncbi:MAG: NRDE family protein [Legionella sp.]|nr:NRDE family protein [Legionella sp.]
MCLILIALNQHPLYPIIILSNRDEFYNRATTPAHYWKDAPYLFAGQDLVGSGTWLGIAKNGAFSCVTNYRNPKIYNSSLLSRGLLVKEFLLNSATTPASDYIKKIIPVANQYNPFNLLVGTLDEILYYSNVENKMKKLSSGLYGLSNHLLNTPWYKVKRAKELFNKVHNQLIACDVPEQLSELLFPILADKTQAPDDLLPHTGVSLELEKSLSSIFITLPAQAYGTRNSTLILFKKDTIFFSEKTDKGIQTEVQWKL